MAKRGIGIDISDRSVEAVSVLDRGQATLTGAVRRELHAGLVTRGVIQDFDSLLDVVRDVLDELAGEDRGKIPVGIAMPETVVYTKVFSLPYDLKPEQHRQALLIKVGEEFPVEAGVELSMDYVEVAGRESERRFLCAVTSRQTADSYLDLIDQAGYRASFLEPESFSLARAVLPGKQYPAMVADIGALTTMMVVFDHRGQPALTSAVPVGGEAMTSVIEKQLGATMSQAERIKREAGFNPEFDEGRVLMILQNPFKEISGEIRKTVDYIFNVRKNKVGRLVLVGGTSLMPGTADYVSSIFNDLSVELGDPLSSVKVAGDAVLPSDFDSEALLYSTAIGSALRTVGTRGDPPLDLGPDSGRRGGFREAVASLGNLITNIVRPMSPTKKKAQPKKDKPAKKVAKKSVPKKKAAPKKAAPKKSAVKKAEPKKKAGAAKSSKATKPKSKPKPKTKEKPKVSEMPAEVEAEEKVVAAPEPVEEPAVEVNLEDDVPEAKLFPAEEAEEDEVKEESGALAGSTARDFGMGIGDILSAKNDDEDDIDEDMEMDPPVSGERLSIESILRGDIEESEPEIYEEEEDDEEEESAPVRETGSHRTGRRRIRWVVVVPLLAFLIAVLVIAKGIGLLGGEKAGMKWPFGDRKQVAQEEEVPQEAEPLVPATVAASVLVTDGEFEEGLAMPAVASRFVETDVVQTSEFEASGSAPSDDARSVGTVTVINETPVPYTFVATTRFLSSDGVLFRSPKAISIPASGSVDIEVVADVPGPEGDIGPSDFTIPGLSAALQEKVYGRSRSSMTGGSGSVSIVAEEDIESARSQLIDHLMMEARDNFKSMVGEGELALDDLVTYQELSADYPEPGTEAGSFEMTLSVRFRALLIPQAEVMEILEGNLESILPEGSVPADHPLGEPLYTLEAFDTESGRAQVRVEAPVER